MAPLANAVLLEDATDLDTDDFTDPDHPDLDPAADIADVADSDSDSTVIPISDLATFPYSSATIVDFLTDLKDKLGPGNYLGIAHRSGVSRWHVGRILSGRAKGWSPEVGYKIAEAAGVTYDELYQWWRLVREQRQRTDGREV